MEHDIEFMLKNRLCCFCEHRDYKFFTEWCKITNDCRNLCAKTCEHYSPKTTTAAAN